MASAAKTPNLNLPQWASDEKPERTDFNAAFDAIDSHVGGILHAKATLSASTSMSSATIGTAITLDAISGDMSLSSGGILVPTGDWLAIISAGIRYNSNDTGYRSVYIYTNTTSDAANRANAVSGSDTYITTAYVRTVSGGDVLYLRGQQNSGSALDVLAMADLTHLAITLIPIA